MVFSAIQTMTDVGINQIKKENDYLIMKFFGLETIFRENQDEH